MELHMNDLSLNGQFSTVQALRQSLEPLLALRLKNEDFRKRFYISRELYNQPATASQSLFTAIQTLGDRDFKTVVAKWLSVGPFWNDERCLHQDDYFEFEGDDVTEQGLGEASRRQIVGVNVHALSITDSGKNCEVTPLKIQHGLTGAVFDHYDIKNIWDISTLEATISSSKPEPQNWNEFLKDIQSQFSETLIISDSACDDLNSTPFSLYVVRRSFDLLHVLSKLVACRDATGAWTPEGQKLYNLHFQGKKSWFSDESDSNKIKFRQEMTFPDPERPEERLFCPMHGKIKNPQTRIHFVWPIPPRQKLKVVYIGPKITKA